MSRESGVPSIFYSTAPQGVTPAIEWLATHQNPDGSYGNYFEGQAAPAAYALWLNDSGSPSAARSYSYLAGRLDDPSAWFWPSYGEADVPGEVLYTLAISQHLGLLQDIFGVSSRLLQFQKSNGGFQGYYDLSAQTSVTSSVDTALALWGLANAKALPAVNQTAAVNYLLSLQNSDGSFNLTSRIPYDPIYSLGPDTVSITALVTLALRDASLNINDGPVSRGVQFLSQASFANFNGQGHVYAASLSTLAFITFFRPKDASKALAYVLSQQNSDGGFRDTSRLGAGSNALDTGWAAVALQLGLTAGNVARQADRPPVAKLSFSPEKPAVGTTASFDARNSYDPDGDVLSYTWTFGDGSSALGAEVTHTYSRDGVFTITLTATETGANFLSNTTWLSVTVKPIEQTSPRSSPLPLVIWVGLGVATIIAIALIVVYVAFRRKRGQAR